ncbi:hypothetical protein QL285_052622 [Trifolium repens]|nr:hypothetical protein QL285_052622 [Trifolium repens]
MDRSTPALESPAMPAIRRVRDKVEENIDELIDNVGELDVAFIETTNAVFKCYNELEDTLEQKIYVTKDSIDLQEESLYLNLSAGQIVQDTPSVEASPKASPDEESPAA